MAWEVTSHIRISEKPIFTTVPQMPLRPRLLWGAGQVYFLDTPDDGNRKGPRAVETQSSGVALKIQCQI